MYWPVKKILDDIIDNAYKNESEQRRKFYKWFNIDLETKPNNSYLGVYRPTLREGKLSGGTIKVVALNESDTQIIITCIHELSHHIDYCKHNKTGHQAPFYDEFRVLLYTALNMKLFSPDEFQKRVTQDFNKVKKILNEWTPEYIEYKKDNVTIKANVPFDLKDEVKSHGYRWNSVEKTWDKSVTETEFDFEMNYLKALGIDNVKSSNSNTFQCEAIGYIKAGKGSFEYKESLKQAGFFYHNKSWYKKIYAKNYELELLSLSGLRGLVEFKLVSKVD